MCECIQINHLNIVHYAGNMNCVAVSDFATNFIPIRNFPISHSSCTSDFPLICQLWHLLHKLCRNPNQQQYNASLTAACTLQPYSQNSIPNTEHRFRCLACIRKPMDTYMIFACGKQFDTVEYFIINGFVEMHNRFGDTAGRQANVWGKMNASEMKIH